MVTGEPPCSILYFDSEKNAGWIKSRLQVYNADLTKISCLYDSSLAALLKAKDEISRVHLRAIVINGLERLLFTKKAKKASEINRLFTESCGIQAKQEAEQDSERG